MKNQAALAWIREDARTVIRRSEPETRSLRDARHLSNQSGGVTIASTPKTCWHVACQLTLQSFSELGGKKKRD